MKYKKIYILILYCKYSLCILVTNKICNFIYFLLFPFNLLTVQNTHPKHKISVAFNSILYMYQIMLSSQQVKKKERKEENM